MALSRCCTSGRKTWGLSPHKRYELHVVSMSLGLHELGAAFKRELVIAGRHELAVASLGVLANRALVNFDLLASMSRSRNLRQEVWHCRRWKSTCRRCMATSVHGPPFSLSQLHSWHWKKKWRKRRLQLTAALACVPSPLPTASCQGTSLQAFCGSCKCHPKCSSTRLASPAVRKQLHSLYEGCHNNDLLLLPILRCQGCQGLGQRDKERRIGIVILP